MERYVGMLMVLNFLVVFLLLTGTNRICGYAMDIRGVLPAAILGGVYGGACLLPGFSFLGNSLWRVVFLGLMALIAYGMSVSALRRGTVFFLLSMALGGIALGVGDGGFLTVLLSAAGVSALCWIGFRGQIRGASYIPVELYYRDHCVRLTALRDTGNTLCDPVTGRPVLVVSGDVGEKILGLTDRQLQNPVDTVEKVPGLRLIPYRSIGQPGSMLVAIRLPHVKIGNYEGSYLVAFAPGVLDREGAYQALTGGTL